MVTELPQIPNIKKWIDHVDRRLIQCTSGGYNMPQVRYVIYAYSADHFKYLLDKLEEEGLDTATINGRAVAIWDSFFGERYIEVRLDAEKQYHYPKGRYEFIMYEDHYSKLNHNTWKSLNN